MMDLTGRCALVTGASSGLGAHFSSVLARAGARVALAARRADRLEALVSDIAAAGGDACATPMEVTSQASVVSGFDAAESALGPIDTVIVNAGVSLGGPSTTYGVEDFDAVFAVNVRGAFLTAREGARRMIERGADGRITFIASIGGLSPLPGLCAYSASKAAVIMMGRSLAKEWINKGVNVNVICPGYIQTELNSEWFASERGQRQIAGFPRQQLMEASSLDHHLLLLSGAASKNITGSVFKVDDGQTP